MNEHSVRYLKAVAAAVITATLVVGLYSCAPVQSQAPGTSGVSAAPSGTGAASPAPSVVSPNVSETQPEPLTDKQVKELYAAKGLSVLELRDAGVHTMVHYYKMGTPYDIVSRFDWFNRYTGAREFVCGWVHTEKFEITADKTLTVLTTGLPPFDGYQQFPRIHMFGYSDVDGALSVTETDSDYFMPLERSFTLGIDRPECLKSICYDGSSMLLTFDKQPGYAQEIPTDVEAVPEMTVTNKDGISTVTLHNTILSDDFIQTAGKLLDSDPCPVTVACDGKTTVVTFTMRPDTERYNINCFTTPVEHVPHAVITYETSDFGYPKGW